jgi:hypothetical protein
MNGESGPVGQSTEKAHPSPRTLAATLALLSVVTAILVTIAPTLGDRINGDSVALWKMGYDLLQFGAPLTDAVRDLNGPAVIPQAAGAFAPLVPLLLANAESLFMSGLWSGIALSFLALGFSTLLMLPLSRALGLARAATLGSLAAFIVLDMGLRDDLAGGRTITVTWTLCVALLITRLTLAAARQRETASLLGLLAALIALTRFDHGLFAVATVGWVAWGERATPQGRGVTAWILAGFAAPLAAWAAFCGMTGHWPTPPHGAALWVNFDGVYHNTFWATENARSTILTDPARWLTMRAGFVTKSLGGLLITTGGLAALIPLALVARFRPNENPAPAPPSPSPGAISTARLLALQFVALHVVTVWAAGALTPYRNSAYATVSHGLCLLVLPCAVSALSPVRKRPRTWIKLGALVATLEIGLRPLVGMSPFELVLSAEHPCADFARAARVAKALHLADATRPAVAHALCPEVVSFASRGPTMYYPVNAALGDANHAAFVARWQPDVLVLEASQVPKTWPVKSAFAYQGKLIVLAAPNAK